MLSVKKLYREGKRITKTTKEKREKQRERKGPETNFCKPMKRKKRCGLLQNTDREKGDSVLKMHTRQNSHLGEQSNESLMLFLKVQTKKGQWYKRLLM